MKTEFKIDGLVEGEYIDRNSKFLAFVVPVNSESEASQIMLEKRKEHPKANHLCYAYRIRNNNQVVENLSDDGEPTHSAGQPILRQLQAEELINCLAMVVRYFGGVKLGVGGLMKAYKNATKEALSKARLTEVKRTSIIHFKLHYDSWGKVMAFLSKENLSFKQLAQESYTEIQLSVEEEKTEHILEQLKLMKVEIL